MALADKVGCFKHLQIKREAYVRKEEGEESILFLVSCRGYSWPGYANRLMPLKLSNISHPPEGIFALLTYKLTEWPCISLFLSLWMVYVCLLICRPSCVLQSGLQQKELLEVLSLGVMNNPMFNMKGPGMIQGQYPTAFPLKHQQKDIRLSLELG